MSFGKLLVLYAICTVAFFALDFIWLSTAVPRLYRPYLGDLLAEQPKIGVAVAFYLLYVIGVIVFAVIPGLKEGSVLAALWRGALFGFLAYATYDLTNLSTIRDWSWQISAIDMVWGTVLNSAVAVIGFYAAQWLGLGS